MPRATRTARLTGPVVRLACAVLTVLVLTQSAASAMIEGYASYEPQTNCSPNAKPGTLRLSTWLQREYPGSGSLGISRSCSDGGTSEHKEGRAFDWAVNIGSSRDRASVSSFMRRIFATDSEGNTHALARRMGIMYLIWNDQIYSSYYGFRARPYHGCAVLSSCSATLRHRNHVHISLSRAGGAGTTSWYTGATTPPPPAPTPTPAPAPTPTPAPAPTTGTVLDLSTKPYASVSVQADGTPKVTSFQLRAGSTYKITASGLYGYGTPAQVADASCRWSTSTRSWMPYPSSAVMASRGSLNLLVDGTRISSSTCHPTSHVYTRTLRPTRTQTLRLQVASKPTGASGALTVLVSEATTNVDAGLAKYPTLSAAPATSAARTGTGLVNETVSVPAASGTVRTAGSLARGARYRVTVSGTAALGGGVDTDGRCLSVGGTWHPQASLDRRTPAASHGRLYVDGVPFAGTAPTGPTCASRTHVVALTAARTGRLELALWDPLTRTDDTGAVSVQVQRTSAIRTPSAAVAEKPASTTAWRQADDTVRVGSAATDGAVSTMRLRAGQAVTLTARGTTRSGTTAADAMCVRPSTTWTTLDRGVALAQDPLELWVDGRTVAWHPLGGGSGCSTTHAYTTRFVAIKSGPVRLAVLDLDHRDNTGVLDVTMRRG